MGIPTFVVMIVGVFNPIAIFMAVGSTDFTNPSVTYADHTDKIINLMQGVNSNLSISFNTEASLQA